MAVSSATIHFDKLYTYGVPERLQSQLRIGSMVLVPFGQGSRPRMGIVLGCDEQPVDPARQKELLDAAPETACLTPDLLQLANYLKERTFCTYYEAVKAIIPYGAQYRPVETQQGWRMQKQLTRHVVTAYALQEGVALPKLTAKQKLAVDCLRSGSKTLQQLNAQGVSAAVANRLAEKGVLRRFEQDKVVDLYSDVPRSSEPILLTEEQQTAYNGLLPLLECGEASTALLYGVTGSGKTLVFLKLLERCLALGKKALVLVPEISLTPQMIFRLKSKFGRRVAVQHSALSNTERLLQWQMIQSGGADIVVGTRSAVFAPLRDIGLIVMDEEQEHTYRSEAAPRYDAHHIARMRAVQNKALLLLASATPSTETFYAAHSGVYHLEKLTRRYGGNPLPKVRLVNMREELAQGNAGDISRELQRELRENLQQGKQSILLLNRRGYHTVALCEQCNQSLKCPQCSVPMVYHKRPDRLLCHYCGHTITPVPTRCPACGGKLSFTGFGTQRAEDELEKLLPEARVLRMDQDSTGAKHAHEALLQKFAAHEYDILIGTQMVAKGLDFENVTLVGVLGIDSLLFTQGFRAYERVFSLVTQVVGRSGRTGSPGRAIIQTIDPDNPVLNLAAAQDFDAFFEQEIAYRRLCLYPPFCSICMVGLLGAREQEVAAAARRFGEIIAARAAETPGLPLRMLGPSPSNIAMLNGKYRYKIMLKCRNDKAFRRMMWQALQDYNGEKLPQRAAVVLDMNADGDL